MHIAALLATFLVVQCLVLPATSAAQDCQILFIDLQPGPPPQPPVNPEVSRLSELGYQVTETTQPTDLTLASLQQFQVLMIVNGGPGQIAEYQSDLESFVNTGGALFIHSPRAVGQIDYAPTGFEVTVSSTSWCNEPSPDYWCCIIETDHPITSGLEDWQIAASWQIVGSLGPGYSTVLVENCQCRDPALAIGPFGAGLVVFDSGYFAPGNLNPGVDQYITQLMDFLCAAGGAVPVGRLGWGALKLRW